MLHQSNRNRVGGVAVSLSLFSIIWNPVALFGQDPAITAPSNAWTLGDAAGATAAPIIGEVSGALNDGAQFDPLDGPFPGIGSVVLDGSDGEVNMGDGLLFNGATMFSMSFWIKADFAGSDMGFFEPLDNGGSDTWNLRYDSSGINGGAVDTLKIGIQTEDGGFDGEFQNDIQTDEWQHIVFTYDADKGEYILYVGGDVSEPTADVAATGPLASMEYFRLGDGAKAHWAGGMSQVAVWGDHVLTAEEVGVLATTSLQSIFSNFDPDLDDDGLPDVWEEKFGLSNEDPSDAASDGDADGLTALEEYNLGTDPTKADTDGDTLNDKVESNTGTFVDDEDTGTDPNNADTDEDGLADNVETNTGAFASATDTGTDPHKNDTDGDGIRDGTEVLSLASDPNDPNDPPEPQGGDIFWPVEPDGGWDEAYEGDVIPIELDWNHDNGSDEWDESAITGDDGEPGGVEIFIADDVNFMRLQDTVTEGGSGNNRKVTLTKPVLEEGVDPVDEEDSGVTLHFRLRLSTGADLSDAEDWLEGGDGSPVRFGGKGMIGYGGIVGNFGFSLGTTDGDEAFDEPSLMLNGIIGIDDRDNFHPVPDPTQWQEFWVNIQQDPDAEEGTHKVSLWHNGAEEPVVYEVGTEGTGDVSGDPEPTLFMGHPATDQIGAFDLDFLHLKGELVPPTGKKAIFQITDIDCDLVARSCTLVWTASPSATYTVEVSRGPEPFDWLELADGIESEGDTATFTEDNIPADARIRFYRVKKEQ